MPGPVVPQLFAGGQDPSVAPPDGIEQVFVPVHPGLDFPQHLPGHGVRVRSLRLGNTLECDRGGLNVVLQEQVLHAILVAVVAVPGAHRVEPGQRPPAPQGQGQAVDFLRYGIPVGMFLPMVPCDFRHDYITVFDFAPDDFIDFIHYGFLSFENLVFLKMA